MKKLITFLAIVFTAYTMNAQNCQALFSSTTDSTGFTTFTDLSSTQTSSITSWFWDFGDGTSSTLQNAIHQFNINGTYLVCLTIATADSCISTVCDSVITGNGQNPCAGFGMTYQITNVSGYGMSDGAIDVTVYGGTPVYNYLWSTGANIPIVTNLSTGTYCLTVTDITGCTLTNCFYVDSTITNPCQLYVTGIVTDESSVGANDGAIDITANGGLAPYYYYWNNGATTEDISSLSAGTYTVYVEDADSCTTTTTFYVDVQGGQQGQWDTLFTNVVDTCVNFIYDTAFVYNYYMVDSFTVSITWALQGNGQIAYVTVEYVINQFGYNWFVLSINCGTKAIVSFMDLVYIDNSITNIEILNNINSMNLYPNPVTDIFNVELKAAEFSNIDIVIVNSLGQKIYQTQSKLNKGNNIIKVNSNTFEYGVYFIIVTTENGNVITQRFVK